MAAGKDKRLIDREIKEYIDVLISRNIHVLGAYLFGSYVKGMADEWSDIDLAILTGRFIGDSIDFRFMLAEIAMNIDPDIEPHPYLASEFNESNPIAVEIMRT
ncbi:MAG: nucleotidyltransferase domain-containing protein [Deltaproteobacteria bacterium]|nr:nucleotidyltransferase domain-containing protein [Deltaproteobacteria bacterium]